MAAEDGGRFAFIQQDGLLALDRWGGHKGRPDKGRPYHSDPGERQRGNFQGKALRMASTSSAGRYGFWMKPDATGIVAGSASVWV